MTKHEFVELMKGDLKNEIKHMMFYLFASSTVQGLGRVELQEFLEESAKNEMEHVKQFTRFLIDLNGSTMLPKAGNDFEVKLDPKEILEYALHMEEEVLRNYTERLHHCDMLGGEDGTALRIFYEDQIMDSRTDANELRQMIAPYARTGLGGGYAQFHK